MTVSFASSPADNVAINTIRTLALDTVNKANSGHPGAPMGMAPVSHILWSRFLKANPANSKWINRDRFVLSNGHGCALQYVMLHLLGYKVSLDDLKNFRQIDSITPGHPEAGVTDGIEVTTGPLGQGVANAVGLAMAQAHLGATFNKEGFPLIDNKTYVFLGDGCLMEGVASEAASLAGHLKLNNLIAIYDDNHISIDGDTNVAFTENVEQRFLSYGWNVLHVDQGDTDLNSIYNALAQAKQSTDKPTLIRLRTTIGYGSKLEGTHGVHGNPLKPDDAEAIKTKFGFDPSQFFVVPDETKKAYAEIASQGAAAEAAWNEMFQAYAAKYPAEAQEFQRRVKGELPQGWESALPTFTPEDAPVASRKLSESILTKLAPVLPELLSGSADLTGSNLTRWKDAVDFQHPSTGLGNYAGKYIRYGVREHAMGAIANGLTAYGANTIPAIGTFLNFVSYGCPALRLSALSHFRAIWVATHDSIGLGEDGPTHQPIEVAAHIRALPNCMFWRPADGNETSASYLVSIKSTTTPSVLALTRQNLPQLQGSSIEKASKGGYVLRDVANAQITLVATGSEVALAVEAADALQAKGIAARVVSIPCFEVFDKQPKDYRLSVLPDGHPILSLEAYSTSGWERYSHEQYGINSFGASAPAKKVYEKFGLTGSNIAAQSEKVISFYQGSAPRSPINKALLA